MSDIVEDLLLQHKLISDQVSVAEVRAVLLSLKTVLDSKVAGDICEFGCYSGTTSLFISRLLSLSGSKKRLFVYDSFEGLPPKTKEDSSPAGIEFITGELKFSKKSFIENYRKASLKLPIIKKGWFSNLTEDDLPEKIALLFLDGDYYESVLDPLNLSARKLSPGSIIIVDDYLNPKLPGASKAADYWLKLNNLQEGRDYTRQTVSDMLILKLK